MKNNLRIKGNTRTPAENVLWELFQTQEHKIKYLEITPELGLWNWITTDSANASNLINLRFPDSPININSLIQDCNRVFTSSAGNPRENAKNRIGWILSEISTSTNEDIKRIKQNLFSAYVENFYQSQQNRNSLNALLGPIFNRRGN